MNGVCVLWSVGLRWDLRARRVNLGGLGAVLAGLTGRWYRWSGRQLWFFVRTSFKSCGYERLSDRLAATGNLVSATVSTPTVWVPSRP